MPSRRPTRLSVLRLGCGLALAAIVGGCTAMPDVGPPPAPATAQSPYPQLRPLAPVLASVETPAAELGPDVTLAGRLAVLRARAAALRRIDPGAT